MNGVFGIGEYVIYGHDGVCRIEEIGPMRSGPDKTRSYYRLTPHYHSGTIYVPTEGTRIVMRALLNGQEIEALMQQIPELPLLDDVPAEGRQAGEYYRLLLARRSCRELLQLCKTITAKQKKLPRSRRISTTDLRSLQTAKDMLNEEFAFVQGITPEEADRKLAAYF